MMRADLNCKCHATRTDNFTSSCKDVMQDAPTHWVEKLSGSHSVQVEPTN